MRSDIQHISVARAFHILSKVRKAGPVHAGSHPPQCLEGQCTVAKPKQQAQAQKDHRPSTYPATAPPSPIEPRPPTSPAAFSSPTASLAVQSDDCTKLSSARYDNAPIPFRRLDLGRVRLASTQSLPHQHQVLRTTASPGTRHLDSLARHLPRPASPAPPA